MWRSSVLLPQPLPPMMKKISARRTAKDTFSSTTRSPYAQRTPSSSMAGVSLAMGGEVLTSRGC